MRDQGVSQPQRGSNPCLHLERGVGGSWQTRIAPKVSLFRRPERSMCCEATPALLSITAVSSVYGADRVAGIASRIRAPRTQTPMNTASSSNKPCQAGCRCWFATVSPAKTATMLRMRPGHPRDWPLATAHSLVGTNPTVPVALRGGVSRPPPPIPGAGYFSRTCRARTRATAGDSAGGTKVPSRMALYTGPISPAYRAEDRWQKARACASDRPYSFLSRLYAATWEGEFARATWTSYKIGWNALESVTLDLGTRMTVSRSVRRRTNSLVRPAVASPRTGLDDLPRAISARGMATSERGREPLQRIERLDGHAFVWRRTFAFSWATVRESRSSWSSRRSRARSRARNSSLSMTRALLSLRTRHRRAGFQSEGAPRDPAPTAAVTSHAPHLRRPSVWELRYHKFIAGQAVGRESGQRAQVPASRCGVPRVE